MPALRCRIVVACGICLALVIPATAAHAAELPDQPRDVRGIGTDAQGERVTDGQPPTPDQPCEPETSAPLTVLPGNRPRIKPPRDVVVVPLLRGLEVEWRLPGDPTDASYLLEWAMRAPAATVTRYSRPPSRRPRASPVTRWTVYASMGAASMDWQKSMAGTGRTVIEAKDFAVL